MAFVLDYLFSDVCTVKSLGRLKKRFPFAAEGRLVFLSKIIKIVSLPGTKAGQLYLPPSVILRFC